MTEEKPLFDEAIYRQFFEDGEVRPDFTKEYISLWPGWLGKDQLHLLDEVSEDEWLRFNRMLRAVFDAFRMGVVNRAEKVVEFPAQLEPFLDDYPTAMQKNASQFSQFVIPALDCVLTEEWDYTYILWHRNLEALEAITPLLDQAKLKHFLD
jgi:hypothetical protein